MHTPEPDIKEQESLHNLGEQFTLGQPLQERSYNPINFQDEEYTLSQICLDISSETANFSDQCSSRDSFDNYGKEYPTLSVFDICLNKWAKRKNNDTTVFQQIAATKENIVVPDVVKQPVIAHQKKVVSIQPSFDFYRYLFENDMRYHFLRTVVLEEIYSDKRDMEFLIELKVAQVEWMLSRTLSQFKALYRYFGTEETPPSNQISTKEFFHSLVSNPILRNTKVFQKFINLNRQRFTRMI